MKLDAAGFLTLSREILGRGHHLRFMARGRSMRPSIWSGQTVEVAPVQCADLRPGDVVFYQSFGGLVAHRVIHKKQAHGRIRLATRGDGCPGMALELVEPEQVLGRVVAVDWGKGLRIRTDAGPGRFWGILLSQISPLMQWAYPPLSRFKRKLRRLWPPD